MITFYGRAFGSLLSSSKFEQCSVNIIIKFNRVYQRTLQKFSNFLRFTLQLKHPDSVALKLYHVLEICLFYSSANSDNSEIRQILPFPISILLLFLFSILNSEVTLIVI